MMASNRRLERNRILLILIVIMGFGVTAKAQHPYTDFYKRVEDELRKLKYNGQWDHRYQNNTTTDNNSYNNSSYNRTTTETKKIGNEYKTLQEQQISNEIESQKQEKEIKRIGEDIDSEQRKNEEKNQATFLQGKDNVALKSARPQVDFVPKDNDGLKLMESSTFTQHFPTYIPPIPKWEDIQNNYRYSAQEVKQQPSVFNKLPVSEGMKTIIATIKDDLKEKISGIEIEIAINKGVDWVSNITGYSGRCVESVKNAGYLGYILPDLVTNIAKNDFEMAIDGTNGKNIRGRENINYTRTTETVENGLKKTTGIPNVPGGSLTLAEKYRKNSGR